MPRPQRAERAGDAACAPHLGPHLPHIDMGSLVPWTFRGARPEGRGAWSFIEVHLPKRDDAGGNSLRCWLKVPPWEAVGRA